MKMNAGLWIGIIGGIAGLLIAIISVLTVNGTAGIYIALGILMIGGGMFFLFYKLLFAPMIMAARLKKTGIRGKALIKEVRDTGVTVNNSPQVKLVVEVKNSLGQRYTATMRTLISRLQPQMFQPGMTIPVLIDPNDENKMIVDYEGQAEAPSASRFSNVNVEAMKDDMMRVQTEGDAIRLTGKAARAIVKKCTWLGIYVNGNNPWSELEIEVLPDDGPAFSAKVKGAIGEQAVSKYQAGEEIFVKYDPLNKSRVALDHS